VGFVIVMQDITGLKALDRMKDQFIANVSHDLRSPLQVIHAYASLLSDDDLNVEQRQCVEGINRSVERMSRLTTGLLDLAKIKAGVGMEAEPCLLSRIAARVIERLQGAARQKGLRLESQVPDDLPPVEANSERVDQAISNLVDNAIKYTLRGQVTIRAFADQDQVTVSVSDTGIGLMPHEQAELFNKFYRAKNELTGNIEGTGLGLSIVRSIIEQYGGRTWATSTWQRGSTFSFSLPRSR
jgi:signal transduction histidine kinase